MTEPFKKFESGKNTVFITRPKEIKELIERKRIALKIAKQKMINSGGKIENAMQIAEAFGRGLYEDFIKIDDLDQWTIKEWIKPLIEHIFNPLGTGATFTRISNEEANTLVFRYMSLKEEQKEPYLSSLFTYHLLRGVFLSAFPQGELIMKSSMALGAPVDEFTFKAYATEENYI